MFILVEKSEGHLAGQEVGPGLHVQVELLVGVCILPLENDIVLQVAAFITVCMVDEVAGEGILLLEIKIVSVDRY